MKEEKEKPIEKEVVYTLEDEIEDPIGGGGIKNPPPKKE